MNDTPFADQPNMFDDDDAGSNRIDAIASAPAVTAAPAPAAVKRQRADSDKPGGPTAKSAKAHKDRTASTLIVAASHVDLHPSLAIDVDAFIRTYEAVIQETVESLRRGDAPLLRPHVIADSGRYLALDAAELVVAAKKATTLVPGLTLPVLLVASPDPARTVREALATSRGKSGWEQYRALAPIFEGGGVRERLRELGIEIGWETRVSKVLKVGQLDPSILDAVDHYTIPVKEAGQVVDAWKDDERRERMAAVLGALTADSNQRLDARVCFKALLLTAKPILVEPSWTEIGPGRRQYVTAEGTVLATVSIEGDRWTAEGVAMGSAQWQAFGKSMLRRS